LQIAVRYDKKSSQNQALLRLALFETWDGRCHWCSQALEDSTYAEIDHIIPKKKFNELLASLESEGKMIFSEEHLDTLRALPDDPDGVSGA
jgi:5-methylcytosine-specific restriction endonuclease McrA